MVTLILYILVYYHGNGAFYDPLCTSDDLATTCVYHLIPIIPICYAWYGQASLPRMYALKDADHLLQGFGNESYSWEHGHAKKTNGKKLGTFIVGFPKS